MCSSNKLSEFMSEFNLLIERIPIFFLFIFIFDKFSRYISHNNKKKILFFLNTKIWKIQYEMKKNVKSLKLWLYYFHFQAKI